MLHKYLMNITEFFIENLILTFFSNLNRRENPRINIIVVDLVMVTLEKMLHTL